MARAVRGEMNRLGGSRERQYRRGAQSVHAERDPTTHILGAATSRSRPSRARPAADRREGRRSGGDQGGGRRCGGGQRRPVALLSQGASLSGAELQGASLFGAELQGGSLEGAQLQGARLDDAQLQGATLEGAGLLGASLNRAQLQGASLLRARLLGASLDQAVLEAADLSDASLWRIYGLTHFATVAAIRMSGESWLPLWKSLISAFDRRWNDKEYHDLRTTIESLPPGELRDEALKRIESLDCRTPDKTLASCDPSAPPPPEAVTWRKALEAARVDEEAYAEALAKALKELVCSGDDAIYVVRGAGFQERLKAAGAAASSLIDDLTNKDSKDCPVSASLTDADKAKLLRIKQNATKKPGG